MRISDWSSDVCSSDLLALLDGHRGLVGTGVLRRRGAGRSDGQAGQQATGGWHVLHGKSSSGDDSRPRRSAARMVGRQALLSKDDWRVESASDAGRHSILQRNMSDGRRPRLAAATGGRSGRSEEHTSELQSLMRISYAVLYLKK